jgi:rod shape-determining protein MreC
MFGTNGPTPTLTFFGSEDWQIGDVVISSGDDGILPRGLNIGRVISGSDSQFAVELDTGSTPVDWVWIIPFTPISTPEADPVIESESPELEDTQSTEPLPLDRVPDAPTDGEGTQ